MNWEAIRPCFDRDAWPLASLTLLNPDVLVGSVAEHLPSIAAVLQGQFTTSPARGASLHVDDHEGEGHRASDAELQAAAIRNVVVSLQVIGVTSTCMF